MSNTKSVFKYSIPRTHRLIAFLLALSSSIFLFSYSYHLRKWIVCAFFIYSVYQLIIVIFPSKVGKRIYVTDDAIVIPDHMNQSDEVTIKFKEFTKLALHDNPVRRLTITHVGGEVKVCEEFCGSRGEFYELVSLVKERVKREFPN